MSKSDSLVAHNDIKKRIAHKLLDLDFASLKSAIDNASIARAYEMLQAATEVPEIMVGQDFTLLNPRIEFDSDSVKIAAQFPLFCDDLLNQSDKPIENAIQLLEKILQTPFVDDMEENGLVRCKHLLMTAIAEIKHLDTFENKQIDLVAIALEILTEEKIAALNLIQNAATKHVQIKKHFIGMSLHSNRERITHVLPLITIDVLEKAMKDAAHAYFKDYTQGARNVPDGSEVTLKTLAKQSYIDVFFECREKTDDPLKLLELLLQHEKGNHNRGEFKSLLVSALVDIIDVPEDEASDDIVDIILSRLNS